MNSSTRTAAAVQGLSCGRLILARVCFCFVILLVLALGASAQTAVNPTTTTVQYMGNPNPQGTQSPITAPLGGIVLKGTAINPLTGQPTRHLWVADAVAGICRVDPDLDTPGPYAINLNTCPFKINGASITGGPMAFDPGRNFLYFVDEQRASQGIMRIGYLPDGDTGQGLLDFNSLFIMGGNTTGARFGGGTTGCPLPGNPGLPDAAALSPLGDLWVGFKKSGIIVRFNSPGTATQDGFGTCSQFIQQVATVSKNSVGLAWIGHDLWGADGTGPFVVKNADTNCLVPPNDICTIGNVNPNLNIVNTLAAVGIPLAVMGDQYFPATNGNNLYFTLPAPANIAWAGNVSAPINSAAQTLTTTYLGTITPAPSPAIANLNGVAVDQSDPANIVVYSGDDYSGIGALAQGQWFQTCQGNPPVPAPAPAPSPYVLNCPTPAATAAPGIPLNVVAVAGPAQATVSWSPAQADQPVTSYTVHNSFASDGNPVPDVVVTPVGGSNFPATSTVITGLVNDGTVFYGFEVSASNAAGTSAFSAESNHVNPPGIQVPAAPTNASAQPGDTQAFVSWTVSASNGGAPITSYTVTAYIGGVSTGITATVPPPSATSNTGGAVIGGLTNGTTYTFTVHATNIAGNSAESAPTNAVTPSATSLPTLSVAMSGPTSVTSTPVQITYGVTVTNTSNFPATNITVNYTLSTVAAVITATGASRDGAGNSTITTTSAHFLSIGQSVIVAGVTDPSFNGTFTISNVASPTTFTYSQVGLPVASSGSGTATGLPLANILLAQPGQGSCTAAGTGVVSVTCALGNMDPGAVVQINVIVQMQSQPITNTATASGTDLAGTALVDASASKTTSPPAPTVQTVSAAVGITGNAQVPNPNIGQAGNIIWTITNTTQTAAQNVVVTIFTPNGLTINAPNPPSVSVSNNGVGSCAPGTAVPGGTQYICTTSVLGGSTKNGAKPPQSMLITQNVTPPVGTAHGAVFVFSAKVTFGPGGVDTLPNTASVTITVK